MIYRVGLVAALLTMVGVSAFAAGGAPTVVPATHVHWTAGTGPLAGKRVALLLGNPAKAGPFVMRVDIPDGGKFAPHFHPVLEIVTVLQGTLLIGVGDKMNTAKMIALPAGSFFSVPAGLHHYAMARGDTVIQLNDTGPWGMTAVK